MKPPRRCGIRYGRTSSSRDPLVCRRPAGHYGPHALQFKVVDLWREMQDRKEFDRSKRNR